MAPPDGCEGTKRRIEKLLEDALIKVSSVATDILGVSGRAMLEALIAGERDPRAPPARGRLRVEHASLIEALTAQFDEHHAELARMLLDGMDALTEKIDARTARMLGDEVPRRTSLSRWG